MVDVSSRRRTTGDAEAPPAVEVESLRIIYGDLTAVDDVTVGVAPGTVLGVLGHNGAGKSSLVRALAGLHRPAAGRIRLLGADVTDGPVAARRGLGVVGQQTALDGRLTGRQNLVLVARLLGATRAQALHRAGELIDEFRLAEHADRPVRTWSGGLGRRADLACAMVARPAVLLLDEPTTGLDPVSREMLWDAVDRRVDEGAAVVLTTQYMEEADRLADHLLVLAQGRVVVEGTPALLKTTFGQTTAIVELTSAAAADRARRTLATVGTVSGADSSLTVALERPDSVVRLVRLLDQAAVETRSLEVHRCTLDDVYRALHDTLHDADGSPAGRKATA